MRYELIDVMQERNSQRIVEGDPNHAEQVTEFWTFRRPLGSSPHDWRLSAIQQVN
jgi:predicted lipid-binding transport protein (Tim44 family)